MSESAAATTEPVRIRRFSDGDGDAVATLRQRVMEEGRFLCPGDAGCTGVTEGLVLANIISRGGLALCAEVDELVVGHLALERGLGPSSHTGELSLFVDAAWRGRGVGKALLGEAIIWARDQGLEKLCLEVFADNRAAIGLYRNLGFVDEGLRRRQVRRDDGDQDIVLMGLFLQSLPS